MKKQVFTVNQLCLALSMAFPISAFAHGTMEVPVSRALNCFNEGPEAPKSAACQAAVSVSGPQMLYDWSGVNQNPNGDHKAFVPDGQLCGGGKANYAGLNLPRVDWPATPIAPDTSGNFTFVYNAPATHSTRNWVFYVTKDGWNPTQALKWSDLEQFCERGNTPPDATKRYQLTCPLPKNKTGKHIIFNTWQRSDSPEAFYSCSDVTFSALPSTYRELGQIRSSQDLPDQTKVTFRLFDSNGGDLETFTETMTYNGANGDKMFLATEWPYYLAQKVNVNSRYVSIGKLQANGSVVAQKSTQDNRVYALNGAQYTFRVDVSGVTPTPTPPTPTPPTPTPPTPTPPTPTPPTPTPPTPTPPTPTPVSCTVAAWDATTIYTAGKQASYQGFVYTAKWWSQGNNPGTNPTGVWTKGASCGTTTPTPTPPTPTPPTPTPPTPTPPTPTPPTPPTPTPPTPTPPSNCPAWAEGNSFTVGSCVTYSGKQYVALVAHTAYVGAGWNPAASATLWKLK